jgi:fructose-1-phosphate kinase PfkB-like protein
VTSGPEKFVLDTSGPALKAALGYGIHLAKPSRGELEGLTGRDLKDHDVLVSAAQELVASGAVEHLVVTMGHEGALLVSAAAVKRLRARGGGQERGRRGRQLRLRLARNSVSGRLSRHSTRP